MQETIYNAGYPGLIPGSRRSPEEGIHSRVLVWEIPWTEDPGGLQSMVATRVENALMTKPRTALL